MIRRADSVRPLELPKYLGAWQIGGSIGLRISVTKKPRWLTRFLLKWLIEWEWIDIEPRK